MKRLLPLYLLAFCSSLMAESAVVTETKVISQQPEYYHGWPTVSRRANGELWLTWSGGRDAHVCPFGQVHAMTSRDDGKTWTWPRVLLDSATDDRDSGVLETSKGTLIVSTFTSLAYEPFLKAHLAGKKSPFIGEGRLESWKSAQTRLSDEERKAELGQWIIRSTDGGKSWSPQIPTIVNSPHGPIQLKDGRLLYAGKHLWTKDKKIGVAESKDDGLTWQWLAEIPSRKGDDATEGYHELHAVEAADGTLITQIRNHNTVNTGWTLQSESKDGGKTWTEPHPICFGLPSHLLKLRDGRLLMTYGHRRPPFGNQARISTDHGKTWGKELIISADGMGGDLGYPSTLELADGSFLTVWYESMKEPKLAVLRQAKWTLSAEDADADPDPAKATNTKASAKATPPTTPPAPIVTRYVAIDNVCAWPNLTLLPNGSINTTIFGQPSHGQMAGAAECWNSPDGQFWTKRGIPAPNEPHTNRMNVACGLAKNGDLLVLCSGWTDVKQPQRPKQPAFRDDILSSWVCRSSDGGKTWTQIKEFPAPDAGWTHYIPFGDIKQGEDGALHVSCYAGEWTDPTKSTKTKSYRSWHFRSDDDGRSWKRTSTIGEKCNETTLLHLGGKRWMAAARYVTMEIYISEDDGATWGPPQIVTQKNEINGHLLRLKDGRILLAYGNRIKTGNQLGVLAKFSKDEGKTWGEPIRIGYTSTWDCGYPSTVQRADGKLVTAWYAGASEYHNRYHMAVAIWDADNPPTDP